MVKDDYYLFLSTRVQFTVPMLGGAQPSFQGALACTSRHHRYWHTEVHACVHAHTHTHKHKGINIILNKSVFKDLK